MITAWLVVAAEIGSCGGVCVGESVKQARVPSQVLISAVPFVVLLSAVGL